MLLVAVAGPGWFAPATALAQTGSRLTLSGLAGPSPYDLSGTGTGFAAALEFNWRPMPGLVIEPGVTYFTYQSQFSQQIHYLMNELSVQGELPLGRVRPFLGGGAGLPQVLDEENEDALRHSPRRGWPAGGSESDLGRAGRDAGPGRFDPGPEIPWTFCSDSAGCCSNRSVGGTRTSVGADNGAGRVKSPLTAYACPCPAHAFCYSRLPWAVC